MLLDEEDRAVISDFGVADVMGAALRPGHRLVAALTNPGVVGLTPAYAAPELYDRVRGITAPSDAAIDVFAFAITLLEMLIRKQPWKSQGVDKSEIQILVYAGKRPQIDPEVRQNEPELVGLIEACWSHNPMHRPAFSDIYNKLSRS